MEIEMGRIRFDCTKQERDIISQIIARAKTIICSITGAPIDDLAARMDLTACHMNACYLDLKKLLAADDFNLLHDVCGISRHINRKSGKLEHNFLPRCAQRCAA